MRTRRALLLTLATAASSAILVGGAWASAQPQPDPGYVWAQPGTSIAGVTSTEPVAAMAARSMLPCGGYGWAQPGCSLAGVTTTQPR
jgi:hypothetical protein